MKRRHRGEIALIALFGVVTIFILFASIDLPARARLIPIVVGVLTALLILIRIYQFRGEIQSDLEAESDRANADSSGGESQTEDIRDRLSEASEGPSIDVRGLAEMVGWLAMFVVLIHFVGYVASTAIFVFLYTAVRERMWLPLSVGLAVSLAVTIYVIFIRLLELDLPGGILF